MVALAAAQRPEARVGRRGRAEHPFGCRLWEWLDAHLPARCLVYVTIDVDALDPAFAPVCPHRRDGSSLSSYLHVISLVGSLSPLSGLLPQFLLSAQLPLQQQCYSLRAGGVRGRSEYLLSIPHPMAPQVSLLPPLSSSVLRLVTGPLSRGDSHYEPGGPCGTKEMTCGQVGPG